jgi:TPR repeat protein
MHHPNIDEAMRAYQKGDYSRARHLMEKIQGNGDSQFYLAYLYQNGLGGKQELTKAKAIYQLLADSGDSRAMYYLASLFMADGAIESALVYFEKSAEAGHISGNYWTAAIYDGLNGYPKNYPKYDYYIKRAANFGHLFAKRDVAKKEMREAPNLWNLILLFLRYQCLKLQAIWVIIRNPHDQRVR